jgi:stage III sporulation protein AB
MGYAVYALKIGGCVLIISSSLILGNTIKKSLKERVRILSSLQNALRYLINQINTYSILEDGLMACSLAMYKNEGGRDLFACAAENLVKGMEVHEAWSKAVDSFEGSFYLKAEDKTALYEIGAVLGNSMTEIQSEVINNVIERLGELEKKAEEINTRDGGIVTKICIAASVILSVILW